MTITDQLSIIEETINLYEEKDLDKIITKVIELLIKFSKAKYCLFFLRTNNSDHLIMKSTSTNIDSLKNHIREKHSDL